MADIVEIKRRLTDNVAKVAEHLLPKGRRHGHEWRAGSVAGEEGQSLGVHLTGAKAGVWRDFGAPDKGGDLIDLWRECRSVSLPEALDQIRDWLGIERPVVHRPAPREYRRPKPTGASLEQGRVLDYLAEERNVPADVLAVYRIRQDGADVVFPFHLPDGTLAMAKRRRAAAGQRPMPTEADCEPVLFGWQAIPPDAREVVITEGEIDALSMAAYGYAALSVPYGGGGGGKQRWIESEFERMERFERIYLATDMDQPGDEAADTIADRLGRHRCYRVKLPRKDASECLMDGIGRDAIAACIAGARNLDPDGLRRPSDYADEVVALFWPQPGDHVGYATPFDKIGQRLLFRPAEVTIWTGATGSGKSQILSHCAVDWVAQGSRVCLSSLEMKPSQTLKRMVKQALATDRPSEPGATAALRWLDQGLLLYELVGKQKLDEMLTVFDYARAKYGCDQFVIDSLMRLGIAGDDYNTQESAIFRIVDWAISHKVHVHLVAHARKGDRDRKGVPETEDIKGAMEIGANAFNIVSVWRNKDREDQASEGSNVVDMPGVILNVAKQRNGDWEGKCGLWFDQQTYRYHSSADRAGWGRIYLDRNDAREAAE